MPILLNRIGDSCETAVVVEVARAELWKKRWFALAADGSEIAVELDTPARHGSILYGEGKQGFRVEHVPEEVVAIVMPQQSDMAAKIGWYLGNRHIPIEVRKDELLFENFPTITDALDRIGIDYCVRQDILSCRPSEAHRH